MLSLLTAACVFVAGCCFMWGVMSLDWERLRERRMSRGDERLLRKRTLNARREFARELPRAAAKRRREMRRELLASVLSKGGR